MSPLNRNSDFIVVSAVFESFSFLQISGATEVPLGLSEMESLVEFPGETFWGPCELNVIFSWKCYLWEVEV